MTAPLVDLHDHAGLEPPAEGLTGSIEPENWRLATSACPVDVRVEGAALARLCGYRQSIAMDIGSL